MIHDATRKDSFDLYRSSKPTPNFVSGQEHTKVTNLLEVQKMPYLDKSSSPFEIKKAHEKNLILKSNSKDSKEDFR